MPFPQFNVVASKGGTLIDVFVQPGAAKNAIVGTHGAALKVKVRARPHAGRANDALEAILAGALEVPPSDVLVTSGASSRHKRVAVAGMTPDQVISRLGAVLSSRAQ